MNLTFAWFPKDTIPIADGGKKCPSWTVWLTYGSPVGESFLFEDSPPLIPIHGLRGDSAAGKPFSRGNRTCG